VRARVRVRLCVYVYLQRAQSNEEFEKKVRLRPRENSKIRNSSKEYLARERERVAWETLALRF
jgi:hypothetical protein